MRWEYAKREHFRHLAEMNQQLIVDQGHHNPMDVDELEERMERWLTSEYRAVLFHRGSEIVAYALFRDDEWGRTHLRQFFVARGARRQGVGKVAIDLFRHEIVAGKTVMLEVLLHNEVGRAFWEAVGFREYCLTLKWEPPGPPG